MWFVAKAAALWDPDRGIRSRDQGACGKVEVPLRLRATSPWIVRGMHATAERTGGRDPGASLLDPIHERPIRRHDGDGLWSLGFGDELHDVVIGRVASRP